eukprot:1195271-Prorocentrum_minimum.AAC.2
MDLDLARPDWARWVRASEHFEGELNFPVVEWLNKGLMALRGCYLPAAELDLTWPDWASEHFEGELNFTVEEWLNKGLTALHGPYLPMAVGAAELDLTRPDWASEHFEGELNFPGVEWLNKGLMVLCGYNLPAAEVDLTRPDWALWVWVSAPDMGRAFRPPEAVTGRPMLISARGRLGDPGREKDVSDSATLDAGTVTRPPDVAMMHMCTREKLAYANKIRVGWLRTGLIRSLANSRSCERLRPGRGAMGRGKQALAPWGEARRGVQSSVAQFKGSLFWVT